MHSLDRHLASNVSHAAEKKSFRIVTVGHDALGNNSNSRKSDIAQKVKTRQYFLENLNQNTSKQALLQPGNRKYMCQTKTAGRGEGVYVLVI